MADEPVVDGGAGPAASRRRRGRSARPVSRGTPGGYAAAAAAGEGGRVESGASRGKFFYESRPGREVWPAAARPVGTASRRRRALPEKSVLTVRRRRETVPNWKTRNLAAERIRRARAVVKFFSARASSHWRDGFGNNSWYHHCVSVRVRTVQGARVFLKPLRPSTTLNALF